MPHAPGLVPAGLRPVPDQPGLPSLPDLGTTDFVLAQGRTTARGPARAPAEAGLADAFRLHRIPETAQP
ncbi:hypothetical protein ACFWIQ_19955 [Kitasatospora sp. NPDC127059]|uniref:hypothetical protein n=1 Tax=unclassified Kitasatospora TaxID=2633591 RepID=UPI00365314F0